MGEEKGEVRGSVAGAADGEGSSAAATEAAATEAAATEAAATEAAATEAAATVAASDLSGAASDREGVDFRSQSIDLRAENCIKNHVIAAMGIGLVPSALLDVVGITAIEVKMIQDLARIYKFPVPHRLIAYKVLISLIGSLGPVYFSTRMHAALKGVPLVGHAVYVGLLSVTGGAAVYAVGKVFQAHYQSGGTFLSRDNRYIRDYFKKKYDEGKQVVQGYAVRSQAAR